MERQDKKQEHLLDLQWVRRALLLALFDIGIIIDLNGLVFSSLLFFNKQL